MDSLEIINRYTYLQNERARAISQLGTLAMELVQQNNALDVRRYIRRIKKLSGVVRDIDQESLLLADQVDIIDIYNLIKSQS